MLPGWPIGLSVSTYEFGHKSELGRDNKKKMHQNSSRWCQSNDKRPKYHRMRIKEVASHVMSTHRSIFGGEENAKAAWNL